MKKYVLLFAALTLSSCAAMRQDYRTVLAAQGVAPPDGRIFQSCRGYGCQFVDTFELNDQDWKEIHKPFSPEPKTAAEERAAIAKSIGIFETIIGDLNGTHADIHGTFKKLGPRQHDCTDESINTTTYLSLLAAEGLMTHHTLRAPTDRIPLLHYMGLWPHKTAVIEENDTKERYAIDSWFHDNGAPAEAVLLTEWRAGWKPNIATDTNDKKQ